MLLYVLCESGECRPSRIIPRGSLPLTLFWSRGIIVSERCRAVVKAQQGRLAVKNADRGGVKQLLSTRGKHRKYQPLGSLENYLLELSFALYVVFPLTPFLTLLAWCSSNN